MLSRHRTVTVFVVAMTALMLVAQPALAETVIQACNGTCGSYEIDDSETPKRGANCKYELASGDLDRITVRPPGNVHGYYSTRTWVGWRFIVQRSVSESKPDFRNFYTSSIQKDRSSDAIPEDGFARRAWVAPENHYPTSLYRVRIKIYWYAPGSQTNVEGRAVIEYDWYKSTAGANTRIDEDYCIWFY